MRRLLLETPPQRFARNAIHECALAVDLDYRQPLAIAGLEGGIAGDVHLLIRHALVAEHRACLLAEVASVRRIEDDAFQFDSGSAGSAALPHCSLTVIGAARFQQQPMDARAKRARPVSAV